MIDSSSTHQLSCKAFRAQSTLIAMTAGSMQDLKLNNVGLGKAKSKKKNTEDAVAAPSGAKQVKPKNKKNDQVSEAQKKAKK